MGVYRRSDSPTWWMSLQVEQRRVRLNTGVEDRRLAEEIFAAWKVEVARERWLGARPPDQHYTVKDLIDKYLALVTPRKAPDSQRRDRSVLESFRMRWGSLRLCDLSTDMIEEYLTYASHTGHVWHGVQRIGHFEIRLSGGTSLGLGHCLAVRRHPTESGRWESYSLADLRGRAPPSFTMSPMAS